MSENMDMTFEKDFYEGVLKYSPNAVDVLVQLGEIYTLLGEWEKGLEMDLKLFQMRPNDPYVLYNLSCSYSLLKDTNKAFEALERAFACGYRDFKYAQEDHDLENIRNDSRFGSFWSRMEAMYQVNESS